MSPLQGSKKSRVGRCMRVLSTRLHQASRSAPCPTPPPLSTVPAEAHQGRPGHISSYRSHTQGQDSSANAGPTQHRSRTPHLPAQDLVLSKHLPHIWGMSGRWMNPALSPAAPLLPDHGVCPHRTFLASPATGTEAFPRWPQSPPRAYARPSQAPGLPDAHCAPSTGTRGQPTALRPRCLLVSHILHHS